MKAATERDQVVLSMLLEHPYLHDGLTAEGAFNYLLGRTHRSSQGFVEKIPKSPCVLDEEKGLFRCQKLSNEQIFLGTKRVDAHGKQTFDKGKPLGMLA